MKKEDKKLRKIMANKCPFILEQLENPEFHKAGRVKDWRNHVDEDMKNLWQFLSMESRLLIMKNAQNAASNEDREC